ncbi:MAG: VWA containing CoxE family protein [Rhizobiales bacterium]|nr:VWA containing CoxE family protein [Hyphomicrobiales bacterium]MBA69344.1 VWA containing CoxE family protein [Hyphomicrobiales bacterium]|tara:strand:+ start:158 stop:1297 length:1140 start_codon:yes stop_codon:yes gene_type:complete
MTPVDDLPRAARPLVGFVRHLRRHGFSVAPEQAIAFMRAITLLGPKSMADIRLAALSTLAPQPDQRKTFEALFRSWFFGADLVAAEGESEEDETEIKDDGGPDEQEPDILKSEEGGELSSSAEQLSRRSFIPGAARLSEIERHIAGSLPRRRSFRTRRTSSVRTLDLRRSLRSILRADGDIPVPVWRQRRSVPRRLLVLIDVSGSMKQHTEDYLTLAHALVRGAALVEVFTFATRLTRVTSALRIRDRNQALARASALVDDWDGGTQIGATLLAFLSVPRFASFARGAAVVIVSDALERGDPAAMIMATRRFSSRAHRLSLATPLAGDPRFRPETEALKAILPMLDDLVDASSIARLGDFLLSLAHPAPNAQTIWGRVS